VVPELADLAKQPAVLVAAGAAATVAGGAAAAYRTCEQLPMVGGWLRRGRAELTRRGEDVIARSADPVKALVASIATEIATIVLERVDVDAIIRDSTATVTDEVMADVRIQSERADEMVSAFVDQMLGRDRPDSAPRSREL
jgi:hypothetical protein